MKYAITTIALIAALATSGCASFYPPANVHELTGDKPVWIDTDASRRGIIVVPKADGKGVMVCAEPSPDIALQTVTQIMAQVTLNNPQVDVKTQLEFTTAVIDLSKRSQTLLFLRETMYRLCEQSLNQNLSSEQVMQLYELAVKTALVMAQDDLAKHQAELAKRLADPAVRVLFNQLTEGATPVGRFAQP